VQDTFELAHVKLAAKVATVLLKPHAPRTIVIGGGGDQSYSTVKGFLTYCEQKGFKPVVINANSHMDVREKREDGGLFSGCQFRMVLEDALFQRLGGRFVQFAAQGTQCRKSQIDFVSQSGGQISWLSDIRNITLSTFIPSYGKTITTQAGFAFHQILSQCAENEKVCFSFTLDAINSAFCPGVSCPSVIGGLTAEEAVEVSMVAGASAHVLLMDISEFSPAIEDFRTGRLASNIIYHFILGSVKPS
jgi:formiminoglutamase